MKFESQREADVYHQQRMQLAEELLLDKAIGKDIWAIQNILMIVADAMVDGAIVTPKLSDFISNAFYEIHKGKKADDAFGISRGKGRPMSGDKAFKYAKYVEDAEGTLEEKIRFVASKYHVSEDTLKGYWKKYHTEIRRLAALDAKLGFNKTKLV